MRYVISLAVGLSLLVVSGTAAHDGPQSWTRRGRSVRLHAMRACASRHSCAHR